MKIAKSALLLALCLGLSATASAKVTVFAAASMTDALQQIADQYQKENPDNKVVFSFVSSFSYISSFFFRASSFISFALSIVCSVICAPPRILAISNAESSSFNRRICVLVI